MHTLEVEELLIVCCVAHWSPPNELLFNITYTWNIDFPNVQNYMDGVPPCMSFNSTFWCVADVSEVVKSVKNYEEIYLHSAPRLG